MSIPWMDIAKKYIGQREIAGTQHNPFVLRMWQRLGLPFKDDETPWCAGFVGSVLEEAGMSSTRSGLALSYKTYGITAFCTYGAIAYMTRKNSAGKVIGGHVAFVAGKRNDGMVMLLGGNQSDMVNYAPFHPDRIQGYRWPKEAYNLLGKKAVLPKFTGNAPVSTNEA